MTDPKNHPDLGDADTNAVLGEQVRRVMEENKPGQPYRTAAPSEPEVVYVDVGDLSPKEALAALAKVRDDLRAGGAPDLPPATDDPSGAQAVLDRLARVPPGEPEPGGSYWEGMGVSAAEIAGVDEALASAMKRIPDLETRALVRLIVTAHLRHYRRYFEPEQYPLVPELMRELLWTLSTTVLPYLLQVAPMEAPAGTLATHGGAELHTVIATSSTYRTTNRAMRRVELDHAALTWLLESLGPPQRTVTLAAVRDDGVELLPPSFRDIRGAGKHSSKARCWVVAHPSLVKLYVPDYEDVSELVSVLHKAGTFRADPFRQGFDRDVEVYADSQLPCDTMLWGFLNGPNDGGAGWCPYVLLLPGPTVAPPGTPEDLGERYMRRREALKLINPAFYVRWSVTNDPRPTP
jgi:hypothetical protein